MVKCVCFSRFLLTHHFSHVLVHKFSYVWHTKLKLHTQISELHLLHLKIVHCCLLPFLLDNVISCILFSETPSQYLHRNYILIVWWSSVVGHFTIYKYFNLCCACIVKLCCTPTQQNIKGGGGNSPSISSNTICLPWIASQLSWK